MKPKFRTYKKGAVSNSGTSTSTSASKMRINDSAKYLVIVESPSKCAKIEEYLGVNYACIASKGHIRSIEGLKKIDSKHDFAITFSLIDEKESHVKMMRSIISNFPPQNIYLATDDDREGEAIAWHLCDIFQLPVDSTNRILFHEITRPAIQHAIAHPTRINMALVHAQHARQVLDILVGFKISPVLWKHIQNNRENGLSAGRCQTPALRLVYENAEKRKTTQSLELVSKVIGHFTSKNISFQLCDNLKTNDDVLAFFNETKSWKHMLSFSSTKQTTKSAPIPFTTSKLLQVSSTVLHFSPKTTMELCQSLYQSGHITYMRTDSTKYSPVFLEYAREYIEKKLGKPEFVGKLASLATNDKQENPHEAIRCTNIHMENYTNANPLLSRMYRLIWKNTVESCMTPANYNQTIAQISAPMNMQYTHTIEIPTHLGWKYISHTAFHANDANVAEESEPNITDTQNNGSATLFYLQSLAKNTAVDYSYIETQITAGRTKWPLYTEASLIQKLEDLGIGRPSTFASIVDTIIERGYVKKADVKGKVESCQEYKLYSSGELAVSKKDRVFGDEKSKLVIQPMGVLVLDFLLQHFVSLFEYDYTKHMEESLDSIASDFTTHQLKYVELCKSCNNQLKELLKPIAKLSKQEWPIDNKYTLVFAKYGPALKYMEEDGITISFKAVKKNIEIDMEKLKRGGEYTAEELMEHEEHLGVYNGDNVLLKNGKYGPYVECGNEKISIKGLQKAYDRIQYADILPYLHAKFEPELSSSQPSTTATSVPTRSLNPSVLRQINRNLSIRKGKFGPYIFYQTSVMTKPQFLNLKKFPDNYNTCSIETLCEWIKQTYEVE